MRAFVGLPCPEGWIGPLVRAQGRLPAGRRVEADDLHLTLAFLDDQPEDRLATLDETLDARPLPAATLRAVSYEALGAGQPRAVVLDVAADDGLTSLRDRVRSAARTAGITLARDRFRPHMTLTRYSRSAPCDTDRLPGLLARLGRPDLPPVQATGATLWSSVLTPDGPLYEPLSTYPLRAA
ncbi:2'-5' RNA ligase [Jannaschia faecimaris]|uniref:RNA 2',3'-cyclic phosphodiesterase n=1 Tax=Jannaschia faecimaris TaxID=1244108 RepID=A0A1H3PYA0_9RHOB|nr:RNA 2',3'-cyclic phosphodiesterase [Jannaschia faecimaris]SDZ05785.1 2'-5' RNA ligase [Jannaschia faecimaris]